MAKPKKAQKSPKSPAKKKKIQRLPREPKAKAVKKQTRKSQTKKLRVKKTRSVKETRSSKKPRIVKNRGKKASTKVAAFRGIPFLAPIPPQSPPPVGGGSVWWSQVQGVLTQKAIEADRRAREARLMALAEAAEAAKRASREAETPSGHAVWQANPSSTERELLTIFSRITYRGGPVEDIRIDRDRNGDLRLYAQTTIGRRRVQVQGYEVIVRDGRSVRSTIFWGQLDKTSASDPRLAFEEGLYPNQGLVDPNVDFVTAWAAA